MKEERQEESKGMDEGGREGGREEWMEEKERGTSDSKTWVVAFE